MRDHGLDERVPVVAPVERPKQLEPPEVVTAEAVREQEKNMECDYPTGSYMPNKSKISQYKGK